MITGAFSETSAKVFKLVDDQGMHGALVWQSTQEMFLVPQVMKKYMVDQWGL